MDTKDIKPFDLNSLTPFFGRTSEKLKNTQVEVPADLRYARRTEKRRLEHLVHVEKAVKHLRALPTPGETLHCVMNGSFHGWDLVPAVLQLAAPATIRQLDVATLGFNNANVRELAELLDRKQIGRVQFVCSCYFKGSSTAEFEYLHHQLTSRGGTVAAVRSHAKLLLLEMSDGRNLVVESSANLRSCHNVEQFTMCDDRGLLEFHRHWIHLLITEANHNEQQRHATRPKT